MNYKPAAGVLLSAAVVFSVFYVMLTSASRLSSVPAFAEGTADTIVIDAGHGGADGGAVSTTGRRESEINLEIAEKVKLLAEFLGYSPIMTRETDEIIYPEEADTIRRKKVADTRARVALVNSCKNALLVSIHQNMYSDSSPRGAQAFFKGGTEALASALQKDFERYVNPDGKRSAKPVAPEIYLFSKTEAPGVLIECGFLSNPDEAKMLETAEHQKLLSIIIAGNVINYIK